jgi:chemotaxis protein CheD
MRTETLGKHRRVILDPGECYASRDAVTLSTLLGSCVAACLFDPVNQVIGMNHFLLSNRRYARHMPACESEAGRYGIHAMELLINEMMKQGARRECLKAKAFGGGSIIKPSETAGNFVCVGEVNSNFIKEFLENERIPLVGSDLGGEKGRVIHFSHGDFSVYVRRIGNDRSTQLAHRDRAVWMKAIEVQEQTMLDVDLWG